MKVVINKCHGGFGLSRKALELLHEKKGEPIPTKWHRLGFFEDSTIHVSSLERHDADLIAVVEQLGEYADGRYSELSVVDIPDGVLYTVEEYDGREWIAEVHRRWG